MTRSCLENARLTPHYLNNENPLRAISREAGKVQHVIYVIKENRSYDQVLGDLPAGNGDRHAACSAAMSRPISMRWPSVLPAGQLLRFRRRLG